MGSAVGHLLGAGAVTGVGMLEDRAGIITFDDGVLWVARPGEDGRSRTERLTAGQPFAASAQVMAVAQVSAWQTQTVDDESDLDDLSETVRLVAGSNDCRPPYLFRLQGRLTDFESRFPTPTHRRWLDGRLVGVVDAPVAPALHAAGAKVWAHAVSAGRSGQVHSARVAKGARLSVPLCADGPFRRR